MISMAAAAVAAAVSCTELGTSTDDSAVNRQTPVSIRFTPSLTYAEKLLLKRNRRMELPMPELLSTSRSCDSVLESDHQANHLDSSAGCRTKTQSQLAFNTNSSNRGMYADSCVNLCWWRYRMTYTFFSTTSNYAVPRMSTAYGKHLYCWIISL